MVVSMLLGFALILAAAAGAIAMVGGEFLFALDLGFFLLVLAAPLAALAAGPGLTTLGPAFRAASPVGASEGKSREAARTVLRFLAAATLLAGVLGFIVNFTWILKDLSDRSLLERSIGKGFVPMIYSLLLVAALYLPLLHRIELADIASGDSLPAPAVRDGRGSRRVLGWLLGFAALVLLVMASYNVFLLLGSFSLFFDGASFCLVLLVPLAMIVSGHGLSGLGRAFAAARGADCSIAELKTAKALFRYLSLSFLIAMGTGLLLGYAYLLSEYYNKQRVGPCVALICITLFWGLLALIGFSLPLEAAAKRRLAAAR